MNISVICQKDGFVIPENIYLLQKIKKVNIISVFQVSSKGSLVNKKSLFFRGFGLHQSFKLGILLIKNSFLNFIDSIFFYKLKLLKSPKSAAYSLNASFFEISEINSKFFKSHLEEKKIDLVISYSAPSIINKEILCIPKEGCINLHCSLLPKYSGLLPSFWTLFHDEKLIGASVHFMDSKIDNGEILGQEKIERPKYCSMYEAIKLTKGIGGKLMLKVINQILDGSLEKKENLQKQEHYRSWPSLKDIKNFKKRGGKLI